MDHFAHANRLNWDSRAELHASDTTGSYRIAKVLAGGSSQHALEASDIVNAILKAGLTLDFLNEHEIVVWKAFADVVETGEDQFELAPSHSRIPMSFSVGATKPLR